MTEWVCDNYEAPTTCLTAPTSLAGRCARCTRRTVDRPEMVSADLAREALNRMGEPGDGGATLPAGLSLRSMLNTIIEQDADLQLGAEGYHHDQATIEELRNAVTDVVYTLGPDTICDCPPGTKDCGLRLEASYALRDAKEALARSRAPMAGRDLPAAERAVVETLVSAIAADADAPADFEAEAHGMLAPILGHRDNIASDLVAAQTRLQRVGALLNDDYVHVHDDDLERDFMPDCAGCWNRELAAALRGVSDG